MGGALMERGDMVFSRDSPVLDYWLSRCDGFSVRSGHRGIGEVERVATHDYRGRAEMLRVRGALGQRLVPADRIAAVVPSRRLLILDRRPSLVGRAARTTWSRRGHAADLAASVATHLAAFARICAHWIARFARVAEIGMRRAEGALERSVRRGTPIAIAAGERSAVQAARFARATRRGGARLDRRVREATPVVIDVIERGVAAAGRGTATASRAGARAARTYGDEMRARRRHRPPARPR
jgi:hypothetical protein